MLCLRHRDSRPGSGPTGQLLLSQLSALMLPRYDQRQRHRDRSMGCSELLSPCFVGAG